MEIDITKFEDVGKSRGGKSSPVIALGRQGYVNINGSYLEENNSFKEANSINMKVMKDGDKIIILAQLLDDDKGTFKINNFKNDKGEIKRKSFSLRSVFKQVGQSYKNYAQKETIKFSPKKQEVNGIDYYILEITL